VRVNRYPGNEDSAQFCHTDVKGTERKNFAVKMFHTLWVKRELSTTLGDD